MKHADVTGEIIAAAIEVHRRLGPGYVERVYESALCRELARRGVPFRRQVRVPIYYRGELLEPSHRVDLIVRELVVVEVKAVSALTTVHRAQAISYLRATGLPLALLMNFALPTLVDGVQRVILDLPPPDSGPPCPRGEERGY